MKWIMAMGAVLAIPALAFGAASYTLTAGGSGMGGATAVTIDPGDSFSIDLGIIQGDDNGVSAFDAAMQASANSVFFMTARSWVLSSDVDENVGPATLTNEANKWFQTTPHSGQNVGAIHKADVDPNGYWPAADFPQVVETITVGTLGTVSGGIYTITLGDAGGGIAIYDGMGDYEQLPLTIGEYQVTITPEPASMLLLAGAVPFLRRRRSA